MSSLNLRLAQQIPVQRQSHRIVYYQLQKLRKPRTLGPPEDERSFLQNRRKQRIGRKAYACHPFHGGRRTSVLRALGSWKREKWNFYSKNNFKIQTCLFTKHESLQGDSPRVHPNILKCSLHSLVTKGIRLVGFATRAMVRESPTHCLIMSKLISDPWGGGRDL